MTGERAFPARTPYAGAVVGAVFVLAPVIAYLGPLGFAVLIALGGLLLTPLWVRRQPPRPVVLIFVALLIWILASAAWSPLAPRPVTAEYETAEALTDLKLLLALPLFAALPGAAAALSGRAALRAVRWLGLALAAYGIMLVLDGGSGASAYRSLAAAFDEPVRPHIVLANLGRGSVLLALLAFPVGMAFHGRGRTVLLPLFAGAAIAPALLDQYSAPIALLAAGAVFWLVHRFGPGGVRAVGLAVVAALLAAPWIVIAMEQGGVFDTLRVALPQSWVARLDIWSFAAERIAERPLRGWGLDASRTFAPAIPLHPHSAPLQLWLELGLHGVILAAVIWWWLFELLMRAARADRLGAAAGAGAAVAWFVIASFSFGLWQEWWLALGALTTAVCAALLRARAWERLALKPDDPGLRDGALQPL